MPEIDMAKPWAHRAFLATILAKGALGLAQLATALALAAGAADRLPGVLKALFRRELAEDPGDFLAGRLIASVAALTPSQLGFYEVYFAAHGLLHLGVVIALLMGHRHAYPAAVGVLALFVVYQGAEWLRIGGTALLLLSAIDLAVIWLTVLEWRRRTA